MPRRTTGSPVCLRAALAATALFLCPAAAVACSGCEGDDELAGVYAYLDLSGMTDEQAASAKLEAYKAYHAKQMAIAKANFIARFKLYSQPGISEDALRIRD